MNPQESFKIRCSACRRALANGHDRDGLVAAGVEFTDLHVHRFDGGVGGARHDRNELRLYEVKGARFSTWTDPATGATTLSFTCRCGRDYRVRYERLVALYRDARDQGGTEVWIDA